MRKKYKCPCCGFYTFSKKPDGGYDICPVCFWEDDPYQTTQNPDETGFSNPVSLNEARANFKKFGACSEDVREFVRKPKNNELDGIDV